MFICVMWNEMKIALQKNKCYLKCFATAILAYARLKPPESRQCICILRYDSAVGYDIIIKISKLEFVATLNIQYIVLY